MTDKPNPIYFNQEEYSDWRVYITHNVTISARKGKEPNRFHRLMQRLILGFKWEKYK